MKPENNTPDDLRLSQEELEGLRRLKVESVFVPPAVDERILGAAADHFRRFTTAAVEAGAGGGQTRCLGWRPVWAVAAGVAVCVGAGLWLKLQTGPGAGAHAARLDVDGDGRVDIVDALVLAQRVESGGVSGRKWDLNRDGAVDARDVAVIAGAVVQLEREG